MLVSWRIVGLAHAWCWLSRRVGRLMLVLWKIVGLVHAWCWLSRRIGELMLVSWTIVGLGDAWWWLSRRVDRLMLVSWRIIGHVADRLHVSRWHHEKALELPETLLGIVLMESMKVITDGLSRVHVRRGWSRWPSLTDWLPWLLHAAAYALVENSIRRLEHTNELSFACHVPGRSLCVLADF